MIFCAFRRSTKAMQQRLRWHMCSKNMAWRVLSFRVTLVRAMVCTLSFKGRDWTAKSVLNMVYAGSCVAWQQDCVKLHVSCERFEFDTLADEVVPMLRQQFLRRNIAVVGVFKVHGIPVAVSNAHLHFNPLRDYVKVTQMFALLRHVASVCSKHGVHKRVLCGDYNSQLRSQALQLALRGHCENPLWPMLRASRAQVSLQKVESPSLDDYFNGVVFDSDSDNSDNNSDDNTDVDPEDFDFDFECDGDYLDSDDANSNNSDSDDSDNSDDDKYDSDDHNESNDSVADRASFGGFAWDSDGAGRCEDLQEDDNVFSETTAASDVSDSSDSSDSDSDSDNESDEDDDDEDNHFRQCNSEVRVLVDSDLRKVGKLLVSLGVDTLFVPSHPPMKAKHIVQLAHEEERVLITRSKQCVRRAMCKNYVLIDVRAEQTEAQTAAVDALRLDTTPHGAVYEALERACYIFSCHGCSLRQLELVPMKRIPLAEAQKEVDHEQVQSGRRFGSKIACYRCLQCRGICWFRRGRQKRRLKRRLRRLRALHRRVRRARRHRKKQKGFSFIDEAKWHQSLQLKRARTTDGDTTKTHEFAGCIDHVFVDAKATVLDTALVLGITSGTDSEHSLITSDHVSEMIPSARWPSDHAAISAAVQL
ncbi:MAG: hypothetical protein MHM6MM_006193 [Cercozoa sp. M6MM]